MWGCNNSEIVAKKKDSADQEPRWGCNNSEIVAKKYSADDSATK